MNLPNISTASAHALLIFLEVQRAVTRTRSLASLHAVSIFLQMTHTVRRNSSRVAQNRLFLGRMCVFGRFGLRGFLLLPVITCATGERSAPMS
jgi:hypothetical protein